MSTIYTGDPTIDGIITWVTNGGHLQSPGAVLGLGMVVKAAIIPLLSRACTKFNVNFRGPNKLQGVVGSSCLLVMAINVATNQHLILSETLLLGVQAGVAAIGIHEASATMSDASKTTQAPA